MTVSIHGKEYKTVVERVNEMRNGEIYHDHSIETEILRFEGADCIIKATIKDAEGRVIATGLAHEVQGSTNINKTSHVENCETSAIGRALAALGLAGTEYASGDEVGTAVINQAVLKAQEVIVRHNKAVRDNFQVILAVKEALAADDYTEASMYFYEMNEEDARALWVAPSKGGIFTTREREQIKSDEYGVARRAYIETQGAKT